KPTTQSVRIIPSTSIRGVAERIARGRAPMRARKPTPRGARGCPREGESAPMRSHGRSRRAPCRPREDTPRAQHRPAAGLATPDAIRYAPTPEDFPMDDKDLDEKIRAMSFSSGKNSMTLDDMATIQPGLARIMPEIGARTWKLFYAAKAQNWPMA